MILNLVFCLFWLCWLLALADCFKFVYFSFVVVLFRFVLVCLIVFDFVMIVLFRLLFVICCFGCFVFCLFLFAFDRLWFGTCYLLVCLLTVLI